MEKLICINNLIIYITSAVGFLIFHTLCKPFKVSYIKHILNSMLVKTIVVKQSLAYCNTLPKKKLTN